MRHYITSVNREQIISINRDKFSIAEFHPDVSKRTGIPVLSLPYFRMVLRNNSFITVDKNASNSAEFVFGALHVDGILGGQGADE